MTSYLYRALSITTSAVGVCLVLTLGVYHGAQTLVMTFEPLLAVRIAIANAVPAIIFFSMVASLSGLLLAREVFQSTDSVSQITDGPRVAAIIPACQDAEILENSVSALLESEYTNLEVVIVCEPDDERTLTVGQRLANHPDIRCLVNSNPGSKAGAINDAVARIDAEYFTALDADEEATPEFVPAAVHQLTQGGQDVFQARRVPRVTGPIEALAYCERLLFNASYKLIEPLGFTYCRSSSVAFTREAFKTVNGLDELITEDIDFAHTCFRHDLDVQQARNITNEMEAPHSAKDFWQQRKRWRLGHIEVLLKALRGNFDRNGLRGALSTIRIMTVLVTSILMVAFVGKLAVLVLLGWYKLFLIALLVIATVVLPVLYADYKEGHVKTLSPSFLLAPLIYPVFGLVTIRAAIEYCIDWDGEWYQISKTGS